MEYNFLEEDTKATFRFFYLNCQSEQSAVLITLVSRSMKIWVNFRLFAITTNSGQHQMHITKLHKGLNTIVVEIPQTTKKDYIFMRVSDYQTEFANTKYPTLFYGNLRNVDDLGYTKILGNHLYDGQPFEFAFFPNNDLLAKNKTAVFRIRNNFTQEILLEKDIEIGKKYSIDLSGFIVNDFDVGNCLVSTVRYTYSNGKEHCTLIPLYTHHTASMLKLLCERAREKLLDERITEYDRLCLRQGIEYVEVFGRELGSVLAQASPLRQNIDLISEGVHRDTTIYQPGVKRIFFYNKTYNAVNYYRIYLPESYSNDKKYPLIVINSTFEYEDLCKNFANYTSEPVIAADISGRGVLLGSYMGEAAINIAMEDLLSRFSIDEDRVYCTGSSNGGGATWAQIEAYPDKYAGAYVVSGHPNYNFLTNLFNLKLIFLSSPTDFMYNVYEKVEKGLENHPDFTGFLGEKYCHNALRRLWFNKHIFDMLLSARRDPYPNKINYRTLRNRHRKAYWIEIHSIDNREVEGGISADVADGLISVRCKGITGFTITIPPQVNRKYFEVIINERDNFVFESFNEDKIYFVKSVSDEETYFQRKLNYSPIIDLHKGNGLLDVYLDPLSIVIPDDSPEFINDVANAYSEPYCNGFVPKIYVKYPIVTYEDLLKAEDIAERSYIVIDDGSEHPLIEEIRSRANIKTNRHGWTFKDEFHNGSYCIHQIVNSPWNPARNIHLISFNDKDILRKNLYTRKVIIPTYANGWHPYWNNDALVFDGKQYFGILDYFTDLKLI